ncbi:hypothetical protein BVY02_00110 [bacterium J17]|nr:hypothetical protein BVY02_00110 [bacterium J17]
MFPIKLPKKHMRSHCKIFISLKSTVLGVIIAATLLNANFQANEAWATEPSKSKPSKFIRVIKDQNNQTKSLDIAIISYRVKTKSGKPATVDLVGTVHIGDRKYYQLLNEEFKTYDSVLYELIAPSNHIRRLRQEKLSKRKEKRESNMVSILQEALKGVLGLEFQLDEIDYTVDNFVHADMSPRQFERTMENRGESLLGMFLKILLQEKALDSDEGALTQVKLVLALLNKDKPRALKSVLADQIENIEKFTLMLDGDEGSTIIGERNNVALARLRDSLNKNQQKIAIYYGAAHMPDLEEKLLKEFGAEEISSRWLTAWDIAN